MSKPICLKSFFPSFSFPLLIKFPLVCFVSPFNLSAYIIVLFHFWLDLIPLYCSIFQEYPLKIFPLVFLKRLPLNVANTASVRYNSNSYLSLLTTICWGFMCINGVVLRILKLWLCTFIVATGHSRKQIARLFSSDRKSNIEYV